MCFRLEMFASRLYIISPFPPRHRYNRSPPLFNYHLINQKSISVLWNGDSLSLSLGHSRPLLTAAELLRAEEKRNTNESVCRTIEQKKKKEEEENRVVFLIEIKVFLPGKRGNGRERTKRVVSPFFVFFFLLRVQTKDDC